jgi:hypothetical protein
MALDLMILNSKRFRDSCSDFTIGEIYAALKMLANSD